MVVLLRLVIGGWVPVDSRDPSARAPCRSIDLCSHPVHHTSRLPLTAARSESRGCPRVPSADRCSNPQSGHSRTKACLISWTSRTALPARENKLALRPVQPIFYLILTSVFVECVRFLMFCLYQYGGYTQGFISQRVSDVGRLAIVSLCHIQTAGRIPRSNLLKRFTI